MSLPITLDIDSIIWLEEFLNAYPGATMLISHDKTFLDNVTTRTVEIVNGKIEDYKCNYSNYLIQRQDRIEKQQQAKKNQEEFIKQTERNIEKFRAKANKAKFAQSLIKKLDKLDVLEVDSSDNSNINFRFQAPPRSGKVVLKAEHVGKKFGPKTVLKNLEFEILRGEKVAFVGKEWHGKNHACQNDCKSNALRRKHYARTQCFFGFLRATSSRKLRWQ
jgi:ATP-binding cassette subfamily F protein 3